MRLTPSVAIYSRETIESIKFKLPLSFSCTLVIGVTLINIRRDGEQEKYTFMYVCIQRASPFNLLCITCLRKYKNYKNYGVYSGCSKLLLEDNICKMEDS